MKHLITIIVFLTLVLPVYASTYEDTITTGISTGEMEGILVESPTANPSAGEYATTQNVVLTRGTGTESIHYTTDGSPVTCTSGSVYSTPIVVSSSLVIGAISCYPSGITSLVAIFGYAINPPTPAPSGGSGGGGGGFIILTTSADPNGDGKVDIFDFNILMVNWGIVPSGGSSADFNNDGVIDIFDFNLLMINWTG